MPVINATIDGVAVEIEEGCTGTQYYESRSDVVAMTVDGNAWGSFPRNSCRCNC